MNKIKNILKGNKLLKIYRIIFKIFGLLPKKKKLVVFESFHGKQFSDSPRAIYEYMENNTGYRLIWSVDRRSIKLFEGLGLPYVKRFTIKWFFLMPRAEFWVNNVRMPNWIPKPKGTTYIQTWHGTPLKKLGLDIDEVRMPGTDTERYKRNFIHEASQWDYLISPNEYSSNVFERAFNYKGNILETGYPRNDFLYNFNEKDVHTIKRKLNIPMDKNVILYAPTWRDDEYYEIGKYKFDLKLDLDLLQERLGDDYIILLRMHYLIAEQIDVSKYNGFAIDVSDYLDIRELYVISDLLITDYSSVFFDYANLQRPILFYVYDLEKYKDDLRGFYFDLKEDAPGPLLRTSNEVLTTILELNQLNLHDSDKFNAFYNRFCYLENGSSSENVVRQAFK